MHARSGQLQGIFGFLKPLIHVWILVWSWSVDKNDPVQARCQLEFPLLGFRARRRWRRKRDVPHVVGGDGEVDADPVALQQ